MTDEQGVNAQEIAEPEAHEVKERKSRDENFAALREKNDHLERELERANYKLKLQEEMRQQAQAPKQPEPDLDFSFLDTEDFAEGKKVATGFKKLKQDIDRKLSEKDQKIAMLESAIQYPDLKDVCSDENVKKYIMNDPDLVDAVKSASNPMQRLYKLIKNNADYRADQEKKNKPVSQESKKLAEDAYKPKTAPIGVRSEPIKVAAKYSEMSRAEKAQLWEETRRLAKQAR